MYKKTYSLLVIYVCIGCSIPLTTLADRVEGSVDPIPNEKEFEVLNRKGEPIKKVSVNKNGEFTVYLPPGLYRVRSSMGQATIRSESIPMRDQLIKFN